MDVMWITRPMDCHLHLRDGAAMGEVVAHSARVFSRAVVMPNLTPPVRTAADAIAYRQRIVAALPDRSDFEPLMTLYLTDTTRPEDLREAADAGVAAVKLYPAGATTNSAEGVTDMVRVDQLWPVVADLGMPLLVHGEVSDPAVDPFDREAVFLDRTLAPLVHHHPRLRVVLEHVSTRAGVDFVRSAGDNVAATVTPHHLLLDRSALFRGGLDPHVFCHPVLKRSDDREAVAEAVAEGHPRFFLGTDSAPHPRRSKERRGAAAGVFNAHAAVELCAEVLETLGVLSRLDAFAGRLGPAFYGVAPAEEAIRLERSTWTVPESYPFGDDRVVPLRAGEPLAWRVVDEVER